MGSFAPNGKWRISSAQLGVAIECARQMGYRAASMDELAQGLDDTSNTAAHFAVTFDDGYLDNLRLALPVCRGAGVPMTVYAATGFIQRTHTAWWHVLEQVLASQDQVELALPAGQRTFACRLHDRGDHASWLHCRSARCARRVYLYCSS